MAWEIMTLVWAGICALAVIMYVLLDGFDLGVGILFPYAPHHEDRDAMMNSVAPVWDFNETWLILGGAGLWAAFPIVYSVVAPALYLPVLFMLIALVFRGVAFEFRFKAERSRWIWDWAFHGGSLVATLSQGVILGAFVQGFAVENERYVGGPFDWLTPFALLCGVGLFFGYALLGCCWLIWKTEGDLQLWCYSLARPLLGLVVLAIAVVSLATPLDNPDIFARWFAWPNILYLSWAPILTAVAAAALWVSIGRRYERAPFLLTMGLFLLSFAGLAVSLWPNVLPPDITIWDAAAPPESQIFLLIGMIFLIPTVLIYTAYTYYVFRGKVKAGYH